MTSLEEIKRLLAAATPGPWEVGANVVFADAAVDYDNENGSGEIAQIEWRCQEKAANAQLIAKAPTLISELIEQVERLQKVSDAAEELPDLYDAAAADPYDVGYSQVSDQIEALRQALEESK